MVLVKITSIILVVLGIIGFIWFSLAMISSGINLFSLSAFLLSILLIVVSTGMSSLNKVKTAKRDTQSLEMGKILCGGSLVICTSMSILFYWIAIGMAGGSKNSFWNIKNFFYFYFDPHNYRSMNPFTVVNILILFFAVSFIFLHVSEKKLKK